MSDYISRQAAIEALAEQITLCDKALKSFEISLKDEYAVKVERASLVAYKEQFEAMPSADVVQVRHGKWIKEWWHGERTRKCSACNITQTVNAYKGEVKFNYCPYCGARMDGEE